MRKPTAWHSWIIDINVRREAMQAGKCSATCFKTDVSSLSGFLNVALAPLLRQEPKSAAQIVQCVNGTMAMPNSAVQGQHSCRSKPSVVDLAPGRTECLFFSICVKRLLCNEKPWELDVKNMPRVVLVSLPRSKDWALELRVVHLWMQKGGSNLRGKYWCYGSNSIWPQLRLQTNGSKLLPFAALFHTTA